MGRNIRYNGHIIMKFKQYIKEQDKIVDDLSIKDLSIKDLVELFNKNCKPYLKDFYPIWKGEFFLSGRYLDKEFKRKKVRTDRKPKDTPIDIHKWIDDWFYEKFGIRVRSNCIFVSFDYEVANDYGDPCYIIPIGRYITIASSIYTDLYNDILQDRLNIGYEKIEKSELISYLKLGKYEKNKKMSNKKTEYMIICKEYYAIKMNSLNKHDIKKILFEIWG
jgi:hypothetical protein